MKRRVVLGVGGGIAAYKSCELLRRLKAADCDVVVVPTEAALKFVGEPTWAALSGHPVSASVWDDVHDVPHVRLGQTADLIVVAPATANLIAKVSHGIADDLLTNVLLTARCPVVMAPAMHTEMWQHPATVRNVATLRERGVIVVEPADGRLTGADSGPGRLPEPADLAVIALDQLAGGTQRDLDGITVVITAGGTREPIDPVRYIGNRSSGKQGWALAQRAVARGADAVLIAANVALDNPHGVRVERVTTANELRDAVIAARSTADVIVMSAAVADYRVATVQPVKAKKSNDPSRSLELVENPDILVELAATRTRPDQILVGFAAETGDADGDVLWHGRAKLQRKGCDLLVVNDVSDGRAFGTEDNAVTILFRNGDEQSVDLASKAHIADTVWDAVVKVRARLR